jgi:hypothetical protein
MPFDTTIHDDTAPDLGTDGAAQLSRPYIDETIASGDTGIGKERSQRRNFADGHLVDRIRNENWINDRQYAAAVILLERYNVANLEPSVTAGYGERRGRSTKGGDVNEPSGYDRWLQLSNEFHENHCQLIGQLVRGQNPGPRWIASIRRVLDEAADVLGISRKARW